MRLFPILTAILVSAFLYTLVIERESLMAFAQGGAVSSDVAGEEAADKTPRVGVVAVKSTASDIANAIILRGQTEAARQVDVRAETSGLVISDPLRKGAFVEAGTILCQLDVGTRNASLAEARAALAGAQARLPETQARVVEARARVTEAQINLNAARKLGQDGFASDTRVASSEAAAESAEAGLQAAISGVASAASSIESAEAAIAAVEQDIERLQISAPFDGLLETDAAELGSLLQPGSACATIIQLDPIKLVGFAPETEVNKLEVGAVAGALLASGDEVTGRVTFLSRSADPATRTFRVEVQVPNSDLSIRDGQTAEILVQAAGTAAHMLPQSALTLNDQGALGVRILDQDNIVTFNPVTLLRDTADGVWLAGLPDQAEVIVVGQEFVTDGVAVDVTYRETAMNEVSE
ncbi:MAG: efflux RND transporter periplasmic adaptor subunit [Paracoccaceae bacterium]|jgi:membrane fusion protein, multidrug efflux system|nr:efflux RND transporter periplasmic adaptor subunit [Paracoccaceae bacterium]